MILLKIFNLVCVGLILSTSIVDGKGKISTAKKTSKPSSSSSSGSGSSSSHRRTTSRPRHTTSQPIVKHTSRPVESSRYPTQPPFNPHFNPQPQPNYPHQTHYPQPNIPHQTHYPNQYPHQTHYPHETHHNYPNWDHKPKKSNVGRNIATHAIAGLGGAYVGHQLTKHNSWYEKKQRERQQERERTYSSSSGTGVKNRTNSFGIDKLKPITPFKVNDISSDFEASKHAAGNGMKMMNDVYTRYNNDPQKNEISKAATANMYLDSKLRPSKSETIPKKNYTTEELQAAIMSSGGMAMIGGALGAVGGGPGTMGVAQSPFNPTGNHPNFGPPNVFGAPSDISSTGPGSSSFNPNQNPFAAPVPGFVPAQTVQTSHTMQTNQTTQTTNREFTITGGQSILQTNQTQIPYKIPLTDPQVLPLVMKKLQSDEKMDKKLRKTSGSTSMYTISNSLILISIVVIKKFYN